jgi:hypothetical protein
MLQRKSGERRMQESPRSKARNILEPSMGSVSEEWKRAKCGIEVFTAVTMNNAVFWDVTLCGSWKNRRCFETFLLTRATQRNIPEDGIPQVRSYFPKSDSFKYLVWLLAAPTHGIIKKQVYVIHPVLYLNTNNNQWNNASYISPFSRNPLEIARVTTTQMRLNIG